MNKKIIIYDVRRKGGPSTEKMSKKNPGGGSYCGRFGEECVRSQKVNFYFFFEFYFFFNSILTFFQVPYLVLIHFKKSNFLHILQDIQVYLRKYFWIAGESGKAIEDGRFLEKIRNFFTCIICFKFWPRIFLDEQLDF